MSLEDRRSRAESAPRRPSVVVALPCFNEAAAIPTVLAAYRSALPEAEVVVFDNASTDGTGELARSLGARVVDVPQQGKGHVVRAIFATFPDVDALVLTDGDGTYPAEAAPDLIALVTEQGVDMAVGARRPVDAPGAMSPIRGLGNLIIPAVFHLLIGPGNSDLLSGYRVFSRRYRRSVRLRAEGFEIETELASEAVARGLRVVERLVPYYPRIAGTTSKLRAFRDGRRILLTIVRQSMRLRPWRILATAGVPMIGLGWALGSSVLMLTGGTLAVLAVAPAAYRTSRDRERAESVRPLDTGGRADYPD